jgi:hypothetical protein
MRKIIFICSLLLFSTLCNADIIYLKDGQIFRGDIVSQDDNSIVIETYNGGEEAIGRQYVDKIMISDTYRSHRRKMRKGYVSDGRWSNDEWIFNLGFDFNGKHETSNSNLFVAGTGNSSVDGTQDVNAGTSFGCEYVSFLTKNTGIGGGLDIQSYRGLTNVPGYFSFFPLYGLIKLRTTPSAMNSYLYLTGQLGYNFFSGDLDYAGRHGSLNGGLYLGLGAGIAFNRLHIELLYTENRGSVTDSGYLFDSSTGLYNYFRESGDIKYSKLGLNIGFVF